MKPVTHVFQLVERCRGEIGSGAGCVKHMHFFKGHSTHEALVGNSEESGTLKNHTVSARFLRRPTSFDTSPAKKKILRPSNRRASTVDHCSIYRRFLLFCGDFDAFAVVCAGYAHS